MLPPPLPENEIQRLTALWRMEVLETPREERFDRVVTLAHKLFHVPIALVSLVDKDRQWFKACYGIDTPETSREASFCAHAILQDDLFEVPNALQDPRFAENPLVLGAPSIRFYAGYPIKSLEGFNLGTLCIIDTIPRKLTDTEKDSLRDLARIVENELNIISIDYARRKAAEAERLLREQERFFFSFMNNSPVMEFMRDSAGRYIFVNKRWEDYTGKKLSEVVGKTSAEIFPPERARQIQENDEKVFANKTTTEFFEDIQGADGSIRHWLSFNFPARHFSGELVMGGVAVDVTDQVNSQHKLASLVEELKNANRAKGVFLANMSHEIRTPMNGVLGLLELLARTELNAQQRDYINSIRSSGKSLLLILNEILDLIKVESGKMTLENGVFDLHQALESNIELLALGSEKKDVEVTLAIQENVPIFVEGDECRLRQVLTNLVSNAVKFTEHGSVTIRVGQSEEHPEKIRFEIEDTGVGIAPETAVKLFQPFTQADSSVTRRFGGTGLGLAICRELVHLMKGDIGVTSKLGRGSIFWFDLPLKHCVCTEPRELHQKLLGGRRFLVIECGEKGLIADHLTAMGGFCTVGNSLPDAAEKLANIPAEQPFKHCVFSGFPSYEAALKAARNLKVIKPPSLCEDFTITIVTEATEHIPERNKINADGVTCLLQRPLTRSKTRFKLTQLIEHDGFTPPPPVKPPQPEEHLHILLAEDNALNQKVALGMIQILGHTADVAWNGQDAIDAASSRPYDLILMDCHMPITDGYEATRSIRKLAETYPHLIDIPILALSAQLSALAKEECIQAGMNGFVGKPVQLDTLEDAIRPYLKGGAEITHFTAPKSPADELPVIDEMQLHELRVMKVPGQPEMFSMLLKMFFEEVPGMITDLESFIAYEDCENTFQKAHELAGYVSNFGANQMVHLCRSIEKCAKHHDVAGVQALQPQIADTHARLAEALHVVVHEIKHVAA